MSIGRVRASHLGQNQQDKTKNKNRNTQKSTTRAHMQHIKPIKNALVEMCP